MEKTLKELIMCFDELPESKGIFISKLIDKYGNHEIYSMLKVMLLSKSTAEFDSSFILINFLYNNLGFIPGDKDIELVNYLNKNLLIENTYEYYLEKGSFIHLNSIYLIAENLPLTFDKPTIIELIKRFSISNPMLLKPLFERLIDLHQNAFPSDIYNNLVFNNNEIEFITKFDIANSWKVDPFIRDSLYNDLVNICPEKYLYSLNGLIQNNKLFLSNDFTIEDTGSADPDVYLLEQMILDYYTACSDAYLDDKVLSISEFIEQKCV
jgi:hypothetical protein